MRLITKLARTVPQFIKIKNFLLFEAGLLVLIIGALVGGSNNDAAQAFTQLLAGPFFLFINFYLLNSLYGDWLFGSTEIYPIGYLHWHVIDISGKYSLEKHAEYMQMVFWCKENCKEGTWKQTKGNWFLFSKKDDALMFRLVW